MPRAFGVLSALLFAATAGLLAGPQGQVPGFRSRITLIPIDVRVVDRDNKPVTDLTRDDFTILENGVRQEIRHFSKTTLTPETPDPDAKLPLRAAPSDTLSPQNRRVFLIVLGRGRLGQPPEGGVTGLVKFVRQQLLPQDHVALMALNRATDFTTDHEKVAQVLERFGRDHYMIDTLLMQRFSGLGAIYGSKTRIPPGIQKRIDDVFQSAAGLGSRYVPPTQAAETPRRRDDSRRTADALQQAEIINSRESKSAIDQARLDEAAQQVLDPEMTLDKYAAANAQTLQDLDNIFAGIEYLRYFEGEKHLIFMTSHGLFLPRVEDDESIGAMANDARVVIDTIVAGIPSPAPIFTTMSVTPYRPPTIPDRAVSGTFAGMSVANISEMTGGRLFSDMYTRQALQRIDAATLSGYLLGYYPADARSDGRYRRITVKVNRPGLTVLYRHGYHARDVLVPSDRKAFIRYSRIAAAGAYPEPVKDIGVTYKTARLEGGRAAPLTALVEVNIVVPKKCFVLDAGRQVAQLDISVFCADAKETLVGEIWQKMDLRLKPDTFERATGEGLPYRARVPLKATARWVKVVVYEPSADIVGSVITKFK